MNLENKKKKTVSLEDLLKIKRCEKPSESFWENFDRELQQKTLQVLVEKPNWAARVSEKIFIYFKPAMAVTSMAVIFSIGFFAFSTQGITLATLAQNVSPKNGDQILFEANSANFVKNNIASDLDKAQNFTKLSLTSSDISSGSIRYIEGNINSRGVNASVRGTLY